MAASAVPTRDLNNGMGKNFSSISQGMPYADCVYAIVLVASTNQTVTVPAGAKWAIFSRTTASSVDFWVNFNSSTAAVPGANVTNGTASVCNPYIVNIDGVASFGIISAGTPTVSIQFYIDGSGNGVNSLNSPVQASGLPF